MVLLLVHIRDEAKLLKPWYARNVPETTTVADVFGELSGWLLDNFSPLPEANSVGSILFC